MACLLYYLQFSIDAQAVELETIMLNATLQICLEIIADVTGIYVGSRRFGKHYAASIKAMQINWRFMLVYVIVAATCEYTHKVWFFLFYLRVGETSAGNIVTVLNVHKK